MIFGSSLKNFKNNLKSLQVLLSPNTLIVSIYALISYLIRLKAYDLQFFAFFIKCLCLIFIIAVCKTLLLIYIKIFDF